MQQLPGKSWVAIWGEGKIGSKTWALSKCVFYRPEHKAYGWPLKFNFEDLGMQRWNKPTDRAQRVDEKRNVFICLVTMFTSRVMFIKMSNNGSFLYFLLTRAKT